MMTEAVPLPPRPPLRFEERAWAPVVSQDEVNEIDLNAPVPAFAPAVPAAPLSTATVSVPAPAKEQVSTQGMAAADAVSQPDRTAMLKTSVRPEPEAADMSWLRKIFIGLGGVLAVASALRIFIG
jgi:hypothetical protein